MKQNLTLFQIFEGLLRYRGMSVGPDGEWVHISEVRRLLREAEHQIGAKDLAMNRLIASWRERSEERNICATELESVWREVGQ